MHGKTTTIPHSLPQIYLVSSRKKADQKWEEGNTLKILKWIWKIIHNVSSKIYLTLYKLSIKFEAVKLSYKLKY